MFIDALGLLSDAQAFTVDANCTNVYDLGNTTPVRNIGDGEPMCLAIGADVASTGGGAYRFNLITSINSNMSPAIIVASIFMQDFATTSGLPAGSLFYLPIPPGARFDRYVSAAFDNVSGTTSVTCTIAIQPMSMIRAGQIYAKGYLVS